MQVFYITDIHGVYYFFPDTNVCRVWRIGWIIHSKGNYQNGYRSQTFTCHTATFTATAIYNIDKSHILNITKTNIFYTYYYGCHAYIVDTKRRLK